MTGEFDSRESRTRTTEEPDNKKSNSRYIRISELYYNECHTKRKRPWESPWKMERNPIHRKKLPWNYWKKERTMCISRRDPF